MRARGQQLKEGLAARISAHGVGSFLSVSGHPTWSFLVIKDAPKATQWEIKTLFMQEMFERGVLTFGTHNISYAHSAADIAAVLDAYDQVLPLLRRAGLESGSAGLLRCEPLQPLFKLR